MDEVLRAQEECHKTQEECQKVRENLQKVLIVDDQPENVELMEAYLFKAPYRTISAYSGQEALLKVKDEKPDLVLLDIMMPGMDGYEVCKLLKNNQETQFIPILMLTALSEFEDRIKGIEAGADDFLTKPINKLELGTRVKSLLRVKCLHDKLVAERNTLEIKNRVRGILTAIIPTLFQSVYPEQRKIVIKQMTSMVEKTVIEMYHLEEEKLDLSCAGKICADMMNQLGGNFSFSGPGEEKEDQIPLQRPAAAGFLIGKEGQIQGFKCPWGTEEARRNPILCVLTREIFSSILSKMPDKCGIEVLKTIGNRDECCLFRIKEG